MMISGSTAEPVQRVAGGSESVDAIETTDPDEQGSEPERLDWPPPPE